MAPIKKIFLLYTLLVMQLVLHGQSKTIDSLHKVIESGNSKEKVAALNALVNIVVYDKPEDAKKYARQSIQIAIEHSHRPGLADAYTRIGIAFDVSGKYDSSVYYYEKALEIYNDLGALRGRGSALNNLGLIYWNMADYNKALTYFFDALKDFETIHADTYRANALNNIGMVYDDTKNYQQALVYHIKARDVYEKLGDNYLKGAVYNNLGNTYSNLLIRDSAEYYYKKAIEMQLLAKDDYGLSIAYAGYAGLLREKKQWDESLEYFKKSLALKNTLNEVSGQSTIYLGMADIYRAKKEPASELECLEKAKDISEKNNLKKDLIEVYRNLSDYYQSRDMALSYAWFKKYSSVKDTVFNENSSRQIAELNTKYETGKKELRLKQQDLLLARKNLFIWGAVALLVLLSFGVFFFYKRSQFRQEKKMQEASMKQQEIITKSIIAAEENERRRIASDLHDGIGQVMSVAKMNLSAFESELVFSDTEQKKNFENVIHLVDESCKELRSISHQMMPHALMKNGLASAVKEFIDRIDQRIINTSLHIEGLNERIDPNVETVLYRVIQECVNNVIRHARATKMYLSLIKDEDGISVSIEDDGKGFDTKQGDAKDGIGLKNIKTRISFLKGTVDFDSAPEQGTLIAIHVPVNR